MKMKSILITIILLLNLSQCIGKVFSYYDLDLNETFIIDIEGSMISGFHYGNSIDICKKSDDNICFNTEYFRISMPKKLYYSTEWQIGKTKYCLVQRLHEKQSKSDTLIVSFGYDGTCKEIKGQGNKPINGVRAINGVRVFDINNFICYTT